MKVIVDGTEYIKKPEPVEIKTPKNIVASNDTEAARLYYQFEPLCPECGNRAFPTNFPATCFGGKTKDKRTVWLCSDMGHCAFSIDNTITWQEKKSKK